MDKSNCPVWKPTVYILASVIDEKVGRLILLLPILFSNVLKSVLERGCLGVVGALSDISGPTAQLRQIRPLSLEMWDWDRELNYV